MNLDPAGILQRFAALFSQYGIVLPALFMLSVWMWTLILLKGFEILILRALQTQVEHGITAASPPASLVSGFPAYRSLLTAAEEPAVYRIRFHTAADKHIGTILVLASIAPLLGLLGTTSGIIQSFEAASQFGIGRMELLSDGIGRALVTTQAGLIAAVPGMFLGGFLRRRAQKLKDRADRLQLRVSASSGALSVLSPSQVGNGGTA